MIISPLAEKTILSPNKALRTAKIDNISIHCMAANATIEACGNSFAKASRQASSNYGIGTDGRIACYVPEEYRSFCTSNRENDNRSITVEVANDGGANTGWHVSDKALRSLICLLTDVCKRNKIPELKWLADKSVLRDKKRQNMTVHRWYSNKSCCGDYLYNLHGWIASEVNKGLSVPVKEKGWMYNGVDYSLVFNGEYYANLYPDVVAVYGRDDVFKHFCEFGMKEKRRGNADFDVNVYAQYPDLKNAFGENWFSYYWHYCVVGHKEGRKTK